MQVFYMEESITELILETKTWAIGLKYIKWKGDGQKFTGKATFVDLGNVHYFLIYSGMKKAKHHYEKEERNLYVILKYLDE